MTYQEFKKKYNGKYVDFDGYYWMDHNAGILLNFIWLKYLI